MRSSAKRDPIEFEGRPGHWSYSIQGKRKPKRGEFYLSGAIVQAWFAPNDLVGEYIVVVPLRRFVMRTEWQLASKPRRIPTNQRKYGDAISAEEK